ncbi:MAG: glucose-6-phosphate isomerase [Proteobacteria bacterium]|nr:glucose-6-phosphate isomerase [Pseudomonadota bacterium]
MSSPKREKIWNDLKEHQIFLKTQSIKDLFLDDISRINKFTADACGIHLDFSKNLFTSETLRLFIKLTEALHLTDQTKALFTGKSINITEKRPALHTALRGNSEKQILIDGKSVKIQIKTELEKMRIFSETIRSGKIKSSFGKPFKTIVNVGIGGSDLGPRLVINALKNNTGKDELKVHFISNVDEEPFASILDSIDIENTLFIIASKTFSTSETKQNAWLIKELLTNRYRKKGIRHELQTSQLYAVTANKAAALKFGIPENNIFEIWDWVGGRYSVWSAMGVSVALKIGFEKFLEFLGGGADMDEHFITAAPEKNIPLLLSFLSVWHRNFQGYASQAILPYADSLSLLPQYLQQLAMESNGKMVNRNGGLVDYDTGPIIWGGTGTNFQHAFAQHLHQSTTITPCDFIVSANSKSNNLHELTNNKIKHNQNILIANCLAQSKALMEGRDIKSVSENLKRLNLDNGETKKLVAHQFFPGSRPSNTIIIKNIQPRTLGSLIAMYEHKTFCEGVIWNINSFDQWGVELGKKLSDSIRDQLIDNNHNDTQDPSTKNLINIIKKYQK